MPMTAFQTCPSAAQTNLCPGGHFNVWGPPNPVRPNADGNGLAWTRQDGFSLLHFCSLCCSACLALPDFLSQNAVLNNITGSR